MPAIVDENHFCCRSVQLLGVILEHLVLPLIIITTGLDLDDPCRTSLLSVNIGDPALACSSFPECGWVRISTDVGTTDSVCDVGLPKLRLIYESGCGCFSDYDRIEMILENELCMILRIARIALALWQIWQSRSDDDHESEQVRCGRTFSAGHRRWRRD